MNEPPDSQVPPELPQQSSVIARAITFVLACAGVLTCLFFVAQCVAYVKAGLAANDLESHQRRQPTESSFNATINATPLKSVVSQANLDRMKEEFNSAGVSVPEINDFVGTDLSPYESCKRAASLLYQDDLNHQQREALLAYLAAKPPESNARSNVHEAIRVVLQKHPEYIESKPMADAARVWRSPLMRTFPASTRSSSRRSTYLRLSNLSEPLTGPPHKNLAQIDVDYDFTSRTHQELYAKLKRGSETVSDTKKLEKTDTASVDKDFDLEADDVLEDPELLDKHYSEIASLPKEHPLRKRITDLSKDDLSALDAGDAPFGVPAWFSRLATLWPEPKMHAQLYRALQTRLDRDPKPVLKAEELSLAAAWARAAADSDWLDLLLGSVPNSPLPKSENPKAETLIEPGSWQAEMSAAISPLVGDDFTPLLPHLHSKTWLGEITRDVLHRVGTFPASVIADLINKTQDPEQSGQLSWLGKRRFSKATRQEFSKAIDELGTREAKQRAMTALSGGLQPFEVRSMATEYLGKRWENHTLWMDVAHILDEGDVSILKALSEAIAKPREPASEELPRNPELMRQLDARLAGLLLDGTNTDPATLFDLAKLFGGRGTRSVLRHLLSGSEPESAAKTWNKETLMPVFEAVNLRLLQEGAAQ